MGNERIIYSIDDLTDEDKDFLRIAAKFAGDNLGKMGNYIRTNSEICFRDDKALQLIFRKVYGVTPKKYWGRLQRAKSAREKQEREEARGLSNMEVSLLSVDREYGIESS